MGSCFYVGIAVVGATICSTRLHNVEFVVNGSFQKAVHKRKRSFASNSMWFLKIVWVSSRMSLRRWEGGWIVSTPVKEKKWFVRNAR